MSDLTDHQRKAGRTKTEKKTKASRRTVAMAREGKATLREHRARYVAALERVSDMIADTDTPWNGVEINEANKVARRIRAELGGTR